MNGGDGYDPRVFRQVFLQDHASASGPFGALDNLDNNTIVVIEGVDVVATNSLATVTLDGTVSFNGFPFLGFHFDLDAGVYDRAEWRGLIPLAFADEVTWHLFSVGDSAAAWLTVWGHRLAVQQ